jgi:hypothetical protein
VPFVLEDRLNERGGIFSKAAKWAPYVRVERQAGERAEPGLFETRHGRAAEGASLWLRSNLIHWKELDRGDHLAALQAA